jgi:murein DD-endopeptidase MepM/ murein hydrolase activator NlpD
MKGTLLTLGITAAVGAGIAAIVWAARPAPNACTLPPEYSLQTQTGQQWERDWQTLERIQATLPDTPDARLELPVPGRISDYPQTYGRKRWGAIHYGQDFVVPVGTPVRATVDGVLWRVGFQPVSGLALYILGAGERRYYYAHLSALEDGVREGATVKAGQLLGYSGSTGMAHGVAHLHFGVYSGNRATCSFHSLDPYPLLKDGPAQR